MRLTQTKRKMPPVPHDIKVYKGSRYALLTREFVEFFLYDEVAVDFYNWLSITSNPDESFFQSLYPLFLKKIGKNDTEIVEILASTERYFTHRYVVWNESGQ